MTKQASMGICDEIAELSLLRILSLVAMTGLAACAVKPAEMPPRTSSEPVVVYSIPAPPSPNPFAKPKPAPDTATGASPGAGKADPLRNIKDRAFKSVAVAYVRIRHDYMDPVDDPRLNDGCRQSMLELAPPAGGPAPQMKKSDGGVAGLRQIIDTLNDVRDRTRGRIDESKIAEACIRGMTQTLERSEFLDKDEFRELQVGTSDLGGIGIVVDAKAVPLVVISAVEGGPASTSALKNGDVITAIDGMLLAPLPIKEAMKRLRGKPGSTITLTVERPGSQEPLRLTLTRSIIRMDSVKWCLLSSGYAYIRIYQFNVGTLGRFARTITEAFVTNEDGLSGVVLDLRDNEGGLLYTSIGVAAAFLPPDRLIAETVGRTADSKQRLYSNTESYVRGSGDPLAAVPSGIKRVPVVVLMNGQSAAGSEIVAAALQHYGRAQVLGERSAGTNTIQSIFPIEDGAALKIATARIYRPSGMPLAATGIEPDISVPVPVRARVYEIGEIAEDPLVRAALGALAGASVRAAPR